MKNKNINPYDLVHVYKLRQKLKKQKRKRHVKDPYDTNSNEANTNFFNRLITWLCL